MKEKECKEMTACNPGKEQKCCCVRKGPLMEAHTAHQSHILYIHLTNYICLTEPTSTSETAHLHHSPHINDTDCTSAS